MSSIGEGQPVRLPQVQIQQGQPRRSNARIELFSRTTFDENVRASKNEGNYELVTIPSQKVHKVGTTYFVEEDNGDIYQMDLDYYNAAIALLSQTLRREKHNAIFDAGEKFKEAVQAAKNSGVIATNNTRIGEITTNIDVFVGDTSGAKPTV